MRALLVLVFTHSLPAADLQSEALTKMAHAHSTAQIHLIYKEYEERQVVQRACRLQIREKLLPFACYELLQLDKKAGKLTAAEFARRQAGLDDVCVNSAKSLDVPDAALSTPLSTTCANFARKARAIRDYQAEDAETWSEN